MVYALMKKLTAQWLADQVVRPGDTYNENDILVCGVCKEPRQEFQEFPNPTERDPDRKALLKTIRLCKCDRDKKAETELAERKREDIQKIELLRKNSLMSAKLQSASFDDFKVTMNNQKNLKLCKRYAFAFDEMLAKCQGLLLWGNVGTGKSYAAACIANHLIQNKVSVVMCSFAKILEHIQNDKEEESRLFSMLMNVKLVIFDDLGAERETAYALEKMYNIVDSRCQSGLPMILTTNFTLKQMQEETDIRYARIYDRIFEVCYPMQFTGESFRKKEAFNRFNEMNKFFEDGD